MGIKIDNLFEPTGEEKIVETARKALLQMIVIGLNHHFILKKKIRKKNMILQKILRKKI